MTKNNAIEIIENVYGFNDPSSSVGEAWAYIRKIISVYEELLYEFSEDRPLTSEDAYNMIIDSRLAISEYN